MAICGIVVCLEGLEVGVLGRYRVRPLRFKLRPFMRRSFRFSDIALLRIFSHQTNPLDLPATSTYLPTVLYCLVYSVSFFTGAGCFLGQWYGMLMLALIPQ